MKLFAMEKELRIIRNRGNFPIPLITPQGTKIETRHDKDKILDAVDTEITEMIKAVRESEKNYEREQEEAKARDQPTKTGKGNHQVGFQFSHNGQQHTNEK